MADILLYNAIAKSTRDIRVDLGEPASAAAVLSNPSCGSLWPQIIPKLTTSNVLCIYDSASGYFRCGGCCLWTVPDNTTKVRFELWGAGSGSAAGNCCGFAPWGANGAYASMIIDATPGCQYTLCAGCAHCFQLYCTQSCDVSGGASYVTGDGVTNLCADGGCWNLCRNMEMVHGQSCYRFQAPGNQQAGGCICSGQWVCNDSGCATCGIVPYAFDSTRKGYGTSTRNGTLYQIPTMWSSVCWDTNFYGCVCNAPIMKPDGTISAIAVHGFTSGTCCGNRCMACTGSYCWPGQGGVWTHVMGGTTELYADWGRTGMVKVSWC